MKINTNSISIVIPVFNEENNIIPLLKELSLALENRIKYEIILVDDGSTDGTVKNTCKYISQFLDLKLIIHEKNYGQSTGLLTGVKSAKYDLIVTLDGDGQNDPNDILKILKYFKKEKPFNLVIGNREKRIDNLARRFSSRAAYFFRNIILGDKIPDTGCALKVFKKSDFLCVPFFNHLHRFLPFIFTAMGGDIVSVNVNHRKRISGYSKYSNIQRALVGIYDLFGVIWLRKRTHSSILIKKSYSSKKHN